MIRAVTLAAGLAQSACDSGTGPAEAPSSLELVSPPPAQVRAGDIVTVRFLIRGSGGLGLAGIGVVFDVLSGGGHADPAKATSGHDGVVTVGWTTGLERGVQELQATAGTGLRTVVAVTALSGGAAALVPLGASRRGLRGNVIDSLPRVRVVDQAGVPLMGEPVTFTPAFESGLVAGAVALSDSDGVVSPGAWQLGPGPGIQRLAATTGTLSAVFDVLAEDPPADQLRIELRFLGPHTEAESAAVAQAAARWQTLVRFRLPDLVVRGSPPECGVAAGELIDDVIVAVQFSGKFDEDPFLALLGTAWLCLARTETLLPAVGLVTLYTGEIEEGGFDLRSVAMHEIGHVLGLGIGAWLCLARTESLLPAVGLVTLYTGEIEAGGFDLRSVAMHEIGHVLGLGIGAWVFGNSGEAYVGERARQAYLLAGGMAPSYCAPDQTSFLCRGFPPVGGIDNDHWSEGVFRTELMTPLANGPPEPLSAVTIAALRDMGYVADERGADPFYIQVSGAPPAAPSRTRFYDRVMPAPLARIDRDGRIIP